MLAIDYDIGQNPEKLREVFGLQVAIFSWLKAFLRHSPREKFHFLIDNVNAWNEVQQLADETGCDRNRLVAFDRRFVQQNYAQFTTIFRADPLAQKILWRRETVPGLGYNFCALAHAIGGLETGVALEQYCLAPTDRSDAIICPSRAVATAIRSFFDMYDDYLQKRFGGNFHCPVQLPIIPLGIEVEKFERRATPQKRADQRQKLGLNENDIVLLWVGRLSRAIKAHPLAMFQAAERAAELTGAKVHLVMQGYFVPDTDEQHFRNLAADFCSKAKVTFVPNLDPRFPDGLWAAGDIFLSLVDNMQESFGLTPLEAMAAGLPRVLSDWDGYRDSVSHGEDGFLITTHQPPPGTGMALSELLLSDQEMYGGFLAKTALSVTVDQEMAAQCIATLIQDKNLRRSMADKARKRVRETYDWKNIIPRYENYWAEMAEQRRRDQANATKTKWASVPPQVPDPFTMYAAYPTSPLNENAHVFVVANADQTKTMWKHEINTFGLDMLIPPEESIKLVNTIAKHGNMKIADILHTNPNLDRPQLWRTLGWLIKLGILRYAPG
jgi:glycosyltransferase involved in cell wall biosynthesis